jgi:DNA-binding beta-propeller fold protein YncE
MSLAVACAALLAAGCGNTYRPVVAAIAPVGPAGQPTKYAVAISSAGPTANGLMTLVDFSGDTILDTTLIGLNPYYFILANSSEGETLNSDGTLTAFDVSTSLIESQVLQSTLYSNSNAVSMTEAGSSLYIAEAGRDSVAQATSLPPGIIQEFNTTLPPVYIVGISGAPRVFALVPAATAAANGSSVTIDTTSNTVTNTIPVGINPTYGVMTADTRRAFILNKGSNNVTVINSQSNALDTFYANGCNPAISTTPCTVSSTISAGVAPVWADFSPLMNELVIANQGPPQFAIKSYSITGNVVTFQTSAQALTAGQQLTLFNFPTSTFFNSQTVTVASTGLSSTSFQVPFVHANVAATTEAASGVGNGSITIVSIPECTQTTVTTNPNCDPSNPIDAVGFGTIVATIPVGPQPVMVGVMQDGSEAFVANAGVPCSPTPTNCTAAGSLQGTPGSVSVINLSTDAVVATVPGISQNASTETDVYVHGHPTYIGVTTGSPTGKAYVVSSDSTDLTIIRSDINAIQTHLSLQGFGVSLRMTAP